MLLPILYEDDLIVAVDKPAGQLVHPAEIPKPGDLVTLKLLRDQLGQQLHLIHRLDRPTCGVLLFAKNRTAARSLTRAFERRQVLKTYWAIVNGHPQEKEWTCHEPLAKDSTTKAKIAETQFKILHLLDHSLSLIEAQPRTGRYHQIRRHLLASGFPIVGDYRYADYQQCERQRIKFNIDTRMLLQAKQLTFPHPLTKAIITLEAPPDPLFIKLSKA